jgi:folate-binding protein YgfZ
MMSDVMVGEQIEREIESAVRDCAFIEFPLFGRIEVRGADRLDLLHRLSTNNLLTAKPGQIIPTVFTTDKGRIVDFVRVIVRDSSLLLQVSLDNEERFVKWIEKYTIMEDIQLSVISESTEMISFVGPEARSFIGKAIEVHLEPNTSIAKAFQFGEATQNFHDECGTQFIDLLIPKQTAAHLHNLLHSEKVMKMSRAAYETFRIARGIPRYGSELNDAHNPYDVGLKFAISYTKGCYIGQEVIARLDTYGKVQRELVGITLNEDAEGVQAGAAIVYRGTEVGTMTSLSPSAIRGRRIALAVVKKNTLVADNHVSIVFDGKTFEGFVASIPIELLPL